MLKSKRTEEEESLPLTGPMYITSEARMKRGRVRAERTGGSRREEAERGTNDIKRTDLRH